MPSPAERVACETIVSDSMNATENCRRRLADPNMKARLAGLGVTALPGSPADFGKLIAEETEKWYLLVRRHTRFAASD